MYLKYLNEISNNKVNLLKKKSNIIKIIIWHKNILIFEKDNKPTYIK